MYYSKLEQKNCFPEAHYGHFDSEQAAKEECSRESYCRGISDSKCDGKNYKLCSLGYRYRSSQIGSCVYEKRGNAISIQHLIIEEMIDSQLYISS